MGASPPAELVRIKKSEYVFLRRLHDAGLVDIAKVDAAIAEVVWARMRLGMDLLREAALSRDRDGGRPARRALSMCYYGAYHCARALVLYVKKFDCDSHAELPGEVGKIVKGAKELLVRLRGLRNAADYDPYPGQNPEAEVPAAFSEALGFMEACYEMLPDRG
jgi:uncharacterized protein (UPF0332 family)